MKVNSALAQNAWEFRQLLKLVKAFSTKSFLEVGSRQAESLIRFALQLPHGSRIVSVDSNYENYLEEFDFNTSLMGSYDLHKVVGDSHAEDTIKKVKALGPYDFCFIDGDHSREGVTHDYENYAPMSKIVSFHDIMLPAISEFWMARRREHTFMEFVHSASLGSMGIGVLFMDEGDSNII